MDNRTARLVAAVGDAIAAQGITQRELATHAGTSASQISLAMGGKTQMSEQKWRMVCEKLGLDYDEIIADIETPAETEHRDEAPKAAIGVCEYAALNLERIRSEREQRANTLADYAERQIAADIRAGINMEPRDLWQLLEAIRELRGGWK